VAYWDYKVKYWWIAFKKETQFVGNFKNVGCVLLWRLGGKGNLSMVPLSNTLEFFMKSFSCEENVCDIKKEWRVWKGVISFIFIIENGWWIFKCLTGVWFHLKYDRVLKRIVNIIII